LPLDQSRDQHVPRAAKALGLTIPAILQATADEGIE
jgi:hypothetical protein